MLTDFFKKAKKELWFQTFIYVLIWGFFFGFLFRQNNHKSKLWFARLDLTLERCLLTLRVDVDQHAARFGFVCGRQLVKSVADAQRKRRNARVFKANTSATVQQLDERQNVESSVIQFGKSSLVRRFVWLDQQFVALDSALMRKLNLKKSSNQTRESPSSCSQ